LAGANISVEYETVLHQLLVYMFQFGYPRARKKGMFTIKPTEEKFFELIEKYASDAYERRNIARRHVISNPVFVSSTNTQATVPLSVAQNMGNT
jgi:hypothetical protein